MTNSSLSSGTSNLVWGTLTSKPKNFPFCTASNCDLQADVPCHLRQATSPPSEGLHVSYQFVAGSGVSRTSPSRLTFTLPWAQGGMRLVKLEVMLDSQQAKIIARLLKPGRLT